MKFCVAANQIGKSSVQIRTAIDFCTLTEDWPKLWPEFWKTNQEAPIFWYFYPGKDGAEAEFTLKWEREWLPKGKYRYDDEIDGKPNKYKWIFRKDQNKITYIYFPNTGAMIYFHSYGKDCGMLMSTTVYGIFCDEEMAPKKYNELTSRLNATDGYWSKVFTAVDGYEEWRRTMEEHGKKELHPHAFKQHIKIEDCMYYPDGTMSSWTPKKCQAIRNKYTKREELRRCDGRFVLEGGLLFGSFERKHNYALGHKLNNTWSIYAGVDVGSGGKEGHPAAIIFVAVDPNYQQGRVIKCWRGDPENTGGKNTDAGYILHKYQELKATLPSITAAVYDHAAVDFGIIANGAGEPFEHADKTRDKGINLVNTLFAYKALKIYHNDEADKLRIELESVLEETPKTRAKDDMIDALRYCLMRIPWDFEMLNPIEKEKQDKYEGMNEREEYRQKQLDGEQPELEDDDFDDHLESEIDEYNSLHEFE